MPTNPFERSDINGFIVLSETWHRSLLPCFLFFFFSSPAEAQKRKSKWDSAIPVTLSQPTIITTTATLPSVVSVTTTASGTKTTVISAVGTIQKKAKQWRRAGLESPCRPVALCLLSMSIKVQDSTRAEVNWPLRPLSPSPLGLTVIQGCAPPCFSGIVSALACR